MSFGSRRTSAAGPTGKVIDQHLPGGNFATVLEWISGKRKAQNRKQARDDELRASLSDKIARYEAEREMTSPDTEADDHTELMVNGKKLRVAKKEITLTDV